MLDDMVGVRGVVYQRANTGLTKTLSRQGRDHLCTFLPFLHHRTTRELEKIKFNDY